MVNPSFPCQESGLVARGLFAQLVVFEVVAAGVRLARSNPAAGRSPLE
jgi:hypothetical protein